LRERDAKIFEREREGERENRWAPLREREKLSSSERKREREMLV